jgi:hypothetical protein
MLLAFAIEADPIAAGITVAVVVALAVVAAIRLRGRRP